MNTLIVIKADTNDADYVYSMHEEGDQECLDRLKKIWEIVKEGGVEKRGTKHNWPWADYYLEDEPLTDTPKKLYEGVLSEDDIDFFEEYLPYGEDGIHSVKAITFYEFHNKVIL